MPADRIGKRRRGEKQVKNEKNNKDPALFWRTRASTSASASESE